MKNLVKPSTIFLGISLLLGLYRMTFGPYIVPQWDISRCQPISSNPKRVWAFWKDGTSSMPRFVQENIKMWKHFCKGWEIRIVHAADINHECHYSKFLPDMFLPKDFVKMIPQHQSDMVRLGLMRLYGGMYMDVSVILLGPLDNIFWDRLTLPDKDPKKIVLGGFETNNAQRMFEVFMYAALAQETLIVKWHEAFVALKNSRSPHIRDNYSKKIHPIMKNFSDAGLSDFSVDYFCVSWVFKAIIESNQFLTDRYQERTQLIHTEHEPWRWLFDQIGWSNVEYWITPESFNYDDFDQIRVHNPIFKFIKSGRMFSNENYYLWKNLHTNIGHVRRLAADRAHFFWF